MHQPSVPHLQAAPLAGPEVGMTVAHLVMGLTHIKNGMYDAALGSIEMLDTARIYSFLTPLLKGWTHAGAGQTDDAIAALKVMQKRKGLKSLAELHMALISDLAGRTDEAAKYYESVAKAPTNLSLRLTQLMGNYYHRAGDAQKAKAAYDRYAEEHPGSRLIDGARQALEQGSETGPLVRNAADGAAEALMGIAGALNSQSTRETAEIFARLSLHMRGDLHMTKVLLAGLLEDDERYAQANDIYALVPISSPLSYSTRLSAADNMDRLEQTDAAIETLRALGQERPEDAGPMIDLGVHCGLPAPESLGGGHWTFDKAWRCFNAHVSMPAANARFEVLRYHGWPGQAPSYRLGEQCWLDLREQVRTRLGDAFDLAEFHSVALSLGTMGLDTLRDAVLAAFADR